MFAPTIGFIGVGNMGSAIYKALAETYAPEHLFLCDRNQEKLDALHATHVFTEATAMLPHVGVVVLGVKPQSFSELALDLSQFLVISIMAGISTEAIQKQTGAVRVVRSMPNLPAAVGHGLTAWMAKNVEDPEEKEFVRQFFSSFGKEVEVADESLLDAVGALSGAGPAYFFYLTELLEQKAKQLGFPDEQARVLAETTFVGAAELLSHDTKSAVELRAAVTSKGGLTEAAIHHLHEHHFGDIFHQAIDAAVQRSQELSS